MGVMNLGTFFILSFLFVNGFCEKNCHFKILETKADFDECIKGENLVVVEFYTNWCSPCKDIEPKIKAMTAEYDKVTFYKVDAEENLETAEFARIHSVPTYMFYKDGKEVDDVIGAYADRIKEVIDRHM